MRVDVITLFPQMVESVSAYGVTGRAIEKDLLSLKTWNPRDFTTDNYQSVDDRPYGGGPGMVMQVEPLRRCIRAVRERAMSHVKVIYLSPQGKRLDQTLLRQRAGGEGLVLVAGRYEGVDERLIELEIDEEWSIGDYVLSGGELAAMVVIDAIARLQPGALGHGESAQQDSFMDGLLDYPHYTRPDEVDGLAVPQVLLSGDHARINRWRHQQALGRTAIRRPDLLKNRGMTEQERALLDEFMREHDKIAGHKQE
ncbi:MAG: tRNA (guanosine(37)-N1)-methyltransferase TrmD [Pseudomonadota bacterium]